MIRRHVYDGIVASFEEAYGWLGAQTAREMLLSAASWNLQTFRPPKYRIRRHLLLYWKHGWLKSTLLLRFREILGDDLCVVIGDVSNAAFRGTVEGTKFVPPLTKLVPFMMVLELGKVTASSDEDLVQTMLMVLEEGVFTASYAKFAKLSQKERQMSEKDYGLKWKSNILFEGKTDMVMMAATYKEDFIKDLALLDRFFPVVPQQELNGKLTQQIEQNTFNVNPILVDQFREIIKNPPPDDMQFFDDLPAEYFDKNPSPRDCSSLKSYIACRSFWGLDTDLSKIIARADGVVNTRRGTMSLEDQIIEILENHMASVEEIVLKTGYGKSTVYGIIKNLRADKIKNKNGTFFKIDK